MVCVSPRATNAIAASPEVDARPAPRAMPQRHPDAPAKFYQLVISRVTPGVTARTVRGMPKAARRKTTPTPSPAATAARPLRAARVEKEQAILREAEAQFARYGFEGASLESIAAALGLSRHNLLYYFPSKKSLYRRVLDDVMTQWLEGMGELAVGDDPESGLRRYIAAKLRSSRERPDGSAVF